MVRQPTKLKREFEDREFNRVREGLRQLVEETRIAADLIEFLVAQEAPQSLILFVATNLRRLAWDLNALGAGTEPRTE